MSARLRFTAAAAACHRRRRCLRPLLSALPVRLSLPPSAPLIGSDCTRGSHGMK